MERGERHRHKDDRKTRVIAERGGGIEEPNTRWYKD